MVFTNFILLFKIHFSGYFVGLISKPLPKFSGTCDKNSCLMNECDLPGNTITIMDEKVLYNLTFPIYGYHIIIKEGNPSKIYGGDASNYGFTTNIGGKNIMGFAFSKGFIPSGCGILFHIHSDTFLNGINSVSVYDKNGNTVELNIIN